MIRHWKYGQPTPTTGPKDRILEMRKKISAAATARSSGMKMVETPSGVVLAATPGQTTQQQQSTVPRWG